MKIRKLVKRWKQNKAERVLNEGGAADQYLAERDSEKEQFYCPKCGNLMSAEAKFCGKCGTLLHGTDSINENINQRAEGNKKQT